MREGEPSATAQRMAAHRLGFDRVGVVYGDATAEDRLAGDVAGDVAVRAEGLILPYLRARTKFFDRVVVSALDGGLTQVVVAAAGYDGRALRYAKEGVTWFEVDHPDTQRDKLARLSRLGIDASHVTFVTADFGQDDVDRALVAAGFDPMMPSLILCEGIAVYLDQPVLTSLLSALGAVAAPGSRLAISLFVSSDSPGLVNRRADFQASVAALGEPTRTVLTIETAEALLAATGWCVERPRTEEGSDPERIRRAGFVLARPVWLPSG